MAKNEQIIRVAFWGAIVGAIFILAAIPMPHHGIPVGLRNTRDLSNAKQIYLGLKMYAGDHEEKFPSLLPDGSPITTANQAYRALVPEYIVRKSIFYSKGSAWTPREPDDEVKGDSALVVGENAFAYVPNLTDTSNPSLPLVLTAFLEGRPGVYGDDPRLKGGIAEGQGIAFVAVDGSGRLLPVRGRKKATPVPSPGFQPSDAASRSYQDYLARREGRAREGFRVEAIWKDGVGILLVDQSGRDILKPAPGRLAPNQVPLNPE